MTKLEDRLHLFGIRHHGPGSARSLLAALDAADPAIVLIEGPPDADAMIPFAASDAMLPPVALLVHDEADPSQASFYPFAVYSPEWQAMRWALARGRLVRFIDLPSSHQLAIRAEHKAKLDAGAEAVTTAKPESDHAIDGEGAALDVGEPSEPLARSIRRDPLGYLAQIAGYEDGEAWWNALVEQGANSPAIFGAIETAMTELRAHCDANEPESVEEAAREQQREAHMRLEIGAALKESEGAVAVVCGAWHVPALRRKSAQAADRAILKGLPKTKVVATWVPWTNTRLAASSGYGAGVLSPGWYAHLWTEFQRPGADLSPRVFTARWQTRVSALLRDNGRLTSTASVIEATRLAETLAGLRELALPGLDEMREATLATLLYGDEAPWRLVEAELVIGRAIGEIDDVVPQMPLAADLARQQKKLKMKPEALERDLSLDLRSEAGHAKSLLLHRLNLINVPWGKLQGSGSSRGTFREKWQLRWDPEFSVRLAEALVYGTTVEQASGNAAIAAARKAASLGAVSEAVKGCLLAGLEAAARETISILQAQAAVTSDIGSLTEAVPPLVTILRYGTARDMPAGELRVLVVSLTESVSAGLLYACRNLQPPEADGLRQKLAALNLAIPLIESDPVLQAWMRALAGVSSDGDGHPLLRGFAVRVLYEAGGLDLGATGLHLSRALSKSVAPVDAGYWLDGFIGISGNVLIHDHALLALIDEWVAALGEDDFTQQLPMLVRSFSSIDKVERRRMLELLKSPSGATAIVARADTPTSGPSPGFAAALPLLMTILGLGKQQAQP